MAYQLVHHWQMSVTYSSLAGRSILITRPENQSETTAVEILNREALPLYLPCLEMEILDENIRRSIPLLQGKSLTLLFTSCNGVQALASVLGEDFTQQLKHHKITVIGEKTANVLNQFGLSANMQPKIASQQGLIEAYKESPTPKKLIFFRAQEGGDAVGEFLNSHGCETTTIHAYRMKCPETDASAVVKQMQQHEIDAVLLGSPKTLRNYLKRIGNIETANIPAIAVISPQVAAVAEHAGLSVQAVAKTASFDAMLDALADYYLETGAEKHASA